MQGFKFGQEQSTDKAQIEEQMGREQRCRNALEVAKCFKKPQTSYWDKAITQKL